MRFKWQLLLHLMILTALCIQIVQSFSWVYIKIAKSSQEAASEWIIQNIKKNSEIGLENIPIYQLEPDILQKEFYYQQYGVSGKYNYQYRIVDLSTKEMPRTVVITNGEIESILLPGSPKAKLVARLEEERYIKKAILKPDMRFYYLFGSELDYYLSGLLVASPVTITIYQR